MGTVRVAPQSCPLTNETILSMTHETAPIIRNRLWLRMLIGMVMGVVVGMMLSPDGLALLPEETTRTAIEWVALPGAVFLALIKMVVIPLVFCSIVLGITASGDAGYLKFAGSRIAAYFVGTTTVAVLIGVTLAYVLKPGLVIDPNVLTGPEGLDGSKLMSGEGFEIGDSLPSMLVGLLPTNPAKAVVDHSMLQIVIGAMLAGVALMSILPAHSRPAIDLCRSVQEVSIKIVTWAMIIAPYAVFGLLCSAVVKTGMDAIIGLSAYMGTVLLGLFLLLCMYVLLASVLGGRKPFEFLSQIRDAQILAFSTSSSAATMPVSLAIAEEKLKVRPAVAQFVVPLGTTVNMDGTALYQMIAAVFLTQLLGIDLSALELGVLAITIVGASIGSPGTPGVGLVILATILESVGVTAEGIALILAVDRVLDMCRTTVNVSGDLTASVVLDKWLPQDMAAELEGENYARTA